MVFEEGLDEPDVSDVKEVWVGGVGPFLVRADEEYWADDNTDPVAFPDADGLFHGEAGTETSSTTPYAQDLATKFGFSSDTVIRAATPALTGDLTDVLTREFLNISLDSAVAILSETTGVDLTSIAQTTLLSPTVDQALAAIIIKITASDTVTVAPILSIGTNTPDWDDVFLQQQLLGLNEVDNIWSIPTVGLSRKLQSGDALKLDVTTGATAVGLTATVYVMGFTL